MVTTTVKANTITAVDIKHKTENMIEITSTTKIIIVKMIETTNTTKVTNMIEREVTAINRQEQEIPVEQEHTITTIG